MVEEEVVAAGITNERVWAAMRDVPRHLFVPAPERHLAYYDLALPIGEGQTISPPFVVAGMTQALRPRAADKVLEIGTGSGYQAAVLSLLVAEVYSIEIVPPLGQAAERTLRRLGYENVHTKIGDGFQGWREHAPFDKIIVTCSPESIPSPLVEQLREGGTIVIPLGERYQQTLYRFTKIDGDLKAESLAPTFFVAMTGAAESLRRFRDDSGVPRLVNGGFETADDRGRPDGWYYVRQAEVVTDAEAPEGERFLRFRNETPGRGAQSLQALGIDGGKVQALEVAVSVACREVRGGRSAQELPCVTLVFFDDERAPLGSQVLGPWSGTFRWTSRRARLQVPAAARLAVLSAGMNGAVGELSLDRLSIEPVLE
jgi:protein-L-isoaspartate(D-aspartate) O-methyltransferase